MVAAGSSEQTVTSVTRTLPVYMKYISLAIAVGQTPCNLTLVISHSFRPPVNMAYDNLILSIPLNFIVFLYNLIP